MTGILGSANLLNGPSQAIYVNENNAATVATVNICNRNTERSALVRIAVSSTESPLNTDWIEYDVEIPAKGVLERTGIWVNSGHYIVVRSNMPNVNAVAWGATKGSLISVPSLTTPTIGTVTWSTGASLTSVEASRNFQIKLTALDSNNGTVFYNLTSGSSLPSGVGLSTTGILEGKFPAVTTYSFTVTASNGVNSVNRTFSITTVVPTPTTITNPVYETLTFTGITGTLTVTNNGTSTVNIFKTSGSSAWDAQAYSNVGFVAPCTLEFNKLADPTDNGASYAMIGLDPAPATDANYTSIDHAAYPYFTNSYGVYDNGTPTTYGPWSTASKFYIVYSADGSIKHYNGSTLLYTGAGTPGLTRFIDMSIYSVNGTYGGFSNIRLTKNIWDGTKYVQP